MIRILIFGLSTGMGGVETYLMNLYRNIDQTKIQFDFVVSGYNCYFSDEIKALGGEIFYITPKKENVLANIRELLMILKKCKQTHRIVYFNLSALYYNLPFIFTKLYRFPIVIAHGHNTKAKGIKKGLRYYLHCINSKYVSHASDYLLACSNLAGEWVFGRKAVEKERVRIVPNAISSEKYKYDESIRKLIRNEFNIEKNQFVVGNIGRFTYQKNQLFLIDIFKEIKQKNKDAVLLIAGDGELRPQIEKRVTDLGLIDSVILTGVRSDIPDLLQGMDAFVLPSHFEGLGIVLIEAQSTGLQCFTSKYTVPDQVNITGNVKFIELDKTSEYWAKQVLDYSEGFKRIDMSMNIKKAGYDIKSMAEEFQRFILSLNGVKK